MSALTFAAVFQNGVLEISHYDQARRIPAICIEVEAAGESY
jgi:hypothetical protein